MKKLLFTAMIAATLLLCACGTIPSPVDESTVNPNPAIVLRTQYPVYSADCEYVGLIIENGSDADIGFGFFWNLEKKENGTWRRIPFRDDVAFTMPFLTCQSGATFTDICHLTLFDKQLTDGEYRIVKEIGDACYTAEFSIGESPITAKSPHGFAPLEELPEDYTLEQAATDGCVVIRHGELESAAPLEAFFGFIGDGLRSRYRAQLRIASLTYEGDVIIKDVILSQDDRIDLYYDSTRDSWGSKEISCGYYSYFVTDGEAVYLSDFPAYNAERAHYLCSAPAEVCAMIEEPGYDMPQRSWSPDGSLLAHSRGGSEYCISAAGWGTTREVKSENRTDDLNIIDLVWQDESTLLVVAETPKSTSATTSNRCVSETI